MSRYKAATIHLGISSLLALGVISLLMLAWYPMPFFADIRGWPLVGMIIGIDVILGPFLTLIVFKQGKKSLRFDLTVIALIQACALIYGMWAGYVSRVAYVVFVDNQFFLVQANDIALPAPKSQPLAEFTIPPFVGPEYISASYPPEKQKSMESLLLKLEGFGAQNMPEYYAPLQSALPAIQEASIAAEEMLKNPEIAHLMHSHGKDALIAVPLVVARENKYLVVLDAKTGVVIDVVGNRMDGR